MSTNPFPAAIDSFDLDKVIAAIATGFDVNAPFDHDYLGAGLTPLWLAAERNEAAMVEHLLKAGADPNRPAHEVPHFRTYQVEVVRLLLDAGAQVSARDPSGQDLLMHCASRSSQYGSHYAPIAELALARGADPTATDPEGRTAFQLALAQENWDVARAIHGPRLVTGAYTNPLEEAIAVWDDAWAEEEAARVDVSARYDSKGFGENILPLHAACQGNHPAAVGALLKRGADPNALDGEGTPPVLLTCNLEVVKLLVAHGADLNARNAQGQNLLMRAAAHEQWNDAYVDMAKLCLAQGVNPSLRDPSGATALTLALKNQGKKIVTLLRGPLKLPQLLERVGALLGEPAPPLLAALWGEAFKKGECFLSPIGEVDLISEPEQLDLAPYLSDERGRERFKALAFFATEADGGALAFWRSADRALADAPIVVLDNEGCLRRGAASLADYLALGYFELEGKAGLTKARKWLKKQGIDHTATPKEMEAARDALPNPEA